MTKRAVAIFVIAVIFAAGAALAIATSIGGGEEPVHTLPGGEVHTGEMPDTAGER
jgi:hypothetical protein